MRAQLKRIVRTLQSEQYALFDIEHLDDDGLPVSLGKVDLHYTDHGTYGTLLLWQERFASLSDDDLQLFAQGLLDEFSTPMGVSGEYLVECVLAPEDAYALFSNMLDVEPNEEETQGAQ